MPCQSLYIYHLEIGLKMNKDNSGLVKNPKTIALLLWGHIKYDGRVRKLIKSYQKLGCETILITSSLGKDDKKEDYNFKIIDLESRRFSLSILNLLYTFIDGYKACRVLKTIAPYAIHCNDLLTLFGGVLYKKFFSKKVRLIYDAHELYPEMQKNGMRRLFWNIIEKLFIKIPDTVILPEINRLNYFRKKYKISNTYLLENFPCLPTRPLSSDFFDQFRKLNPGKKILLYIGGLNRDRGIYEIILAMNHLKDSCSLIFVGKVNNKTVLKKITDFILLHNQSGNVHIVDPVDNHFVLDVINAADIGLVFYDNSNINNYYCASNKLYEFIMLNKPVITNDYPGVKAVVEKNSLGKCISQVKHKAIIEAVNQLLSSNTSADRKLNKNYVWENQEHVLADVLK